MGTWKLDTSLGKLKAPTEAAKRRAEIHWNFFESLADVGVFVPDDVTDEEFEAITGPYLNGKRGKNMKREVELCIDAAMITLAIEMRG